MNLGATNETSAFKGAEIRTDQLASSELGALNFYQFKTGTAQYFHNRLGQTSLQMKDTPHYALASAIVSGDPDALGPATAYYRDYLSASWAEAPANPKITARIAQFHATVAHYRTNGFQEAPALITLPTSSAPYVVDGNHRVAVAAALGSPLKVEHWAPGAAFLKFNRVREFYGTDKRNMPYQSVYLNGEEVISGRRNDLKDRLAMIPSEAIVGCDILDVGCNVGMSSLLSHSLGARSCLGLEYSEAMVDIANRFSMFSGAYPTVSFRQFDLNTDRLPEGRQFDTAFMFSIHDHLTAPEKLAEIAARHVRRFVVFEAHPGGKARNYDGFLNSGLFEEVTKIGRLHTSRSRKDSSRSLWLCRKPAT